MTKLTLEEFRATKAAPDDAMWHEMSDGSVMAGEDLPQRDKCLIYGAPGEGYLIHGAEGRYFVHAWWYSPLSYPTLAEAETNLYDWYCEFH